LFGTALLHKIKFSLKNVMSNTPKISNPTKKIKLTSTSLFLFL
jgi:hypothetical protein